MYLNPNLLTRRKSSSSLQNSCIRLNSKIKYWGSMKLRMMICLSANLKVSSSKIYSTYAWNRHLYKGKYPNLVLLIWQWSLIMLIKFQKDWHLRIRLFRWWNSSKTKMFWSFFTKQWWTFKQSKIPFKMMISKPIELQPWLPLPRSSSSIQWPNINRDR